MPGRVPLASRQCTGRMPVAPRKHRARAIRSCVAVHRPIPSWSMLITAPLWFGRPILGLISGRGIVARRREGEHLLTWCGEVSSRDDLPPVADFLLSEEDVSAVFVFGRMGGKVLVSARSVTGGPHVGDITKRAMGDIGTGGGHATMAGGSVDLRMGVDLDVDRWVQEDLFTAFLEAAGAG